MSVPESGAEARPSAGDGARVTPEIAAEAAVWIANLHGPGRDRAMEDAFRAWQRRSPAHCEAIEKTTDVWEDIARSQAARAYMLAKGRRPVEAAERVRSWNWRWAAVAGLTAMMAGGAQLFQHWRMQGVYITAVGEQRSVLLDDGTRMLLNTDTHLRVDYDAKQRTVEIRGGEALFEVAKDKVRPFVVRVAGSEVVAVGTAFSVRLIEDPKRDEALTVTLIEGQVNVRPTLGGESTLAPTETVALKPGDRLTLDHEARSKAPAVASKLDRPNLERAMAWKRNEIAFESTPLAVAIGEINRYSRTQIALSSDVQQEKLALSGIYRTGDSASFAHAVAALYGLRVREIDGRLELKKNR